MSKLYSLSLPDWIKGLMSAIIGAALVSLQQILSANGFANIDWKSILLVGLTAGISYLIRKFFTNSQGVAFGIQATKSSP
jgi:hypothetical protein